MNNYNSLRIIEKKAHKPHSIYHSGGKAQDQSVQMTIPKPFALAMGLDEPDCYVISHLVEAYSDNEEDLTSEEALRAVLDHDNKTAAYKEQNKKWRKRGKKPVNMGANNHLQSSKYPEKGRRAYLVVEKLVTS